MKTIVNLAGLLAVLFSSILVTPAVFAQKKVLGVPENFILPSDYSESPEQLEKYLREGTKNKDKKNAWLVISDRASNPVFEKPDLSSTKLKNIEFGEYFYVVDEEPDWVKIIDAPVDELKIQKNTDKKDWFSGWVPKNKILLWNSGLVDIHTNIHRKVLLLNRVDDIQNVLKLPEKVKVKRFKSPTAASDPLPEIQIFDFYFVMKEENGMLLLSTESEIGPLTMTSLVGWVDKRRSEKWNTRLCLEPNFEENGFNERKANPKLQLKAFDSFASAKEFSEGNGSEKGVFWQDDPVTIKRDKLAVENPYRFNGSVMRFPMIKLEKGNGVDYLFSGVIGSIKSKQGSGFISEIGEVDYSSIEGYVTDLERKANNVNIFFVIEGTDSTYAYKDRIIQSIGRINREATKGIANVNYGALIYRDLPEEKTAKGNRLTEHVRLSRDFDNMINFIQNAEFRNYVDRNPYTALYHGMMQALTLGGFRKDDLNIILLIGSYGDFKIDKDLLKEAKKMKKDKMIYEDLTPLYENLNEIDAHLYAVQLRNDGTKASNGFAKQGQILISESAKFAYNKYYGNENNPQTRELISKLKSDHQLYISVPDMPDITEGNDLILAGGRVPGRLLKPETGQYIAPSQLAEVLLKDVLESVNFTKTLKEIVSLVLVTGKSASAADIGAELHVDAGRFAPALASLLNDMVRGDKVANEDLYNSLFEKYKLFAQVYFPTRIQGAKNPAVSYVLFMPESDLVEYKRLIERCLVNESSYDKKRDKLFEIYKELIVNLAGETALRKRKPADFTRGELMQLVQGLYNSGLEINVPLDVRIGDIRDEKKVPNAEIDQLLQHSKKVWDFLDSVLRKPNYDFCYTSEAGNRYYWIPVEAAF